MPDAVAVRLLDEAGEPLVERLAGLVNEVYTATEHELWRPGTTRTTPAEVAALVAARRIAVAVLDGAAIGCIQIRDVASDVGELGMLATAPEYRGLGIGRTLVEFAEARARERGLRAMRLELLVPRGWRHPHKEFLRAWYERLGYELVATLPVAEVHPHLAALQATPCAVLRYEKPLVSDRAGTAPHRGGW